MRDRVHFFSDDFPGMIVRATETHALAERLPNRMVQSGSAAALAQVHFMRGEYEQALGWAQRCLEVARIVGFRRRAPVLAERRGGSGNSRQRQRRQAGQQTASRCAQSVLSTPHTDPSFPGPWSIGECSTCGREPATWRHSLVTGR